MRRQLSRPLFYDFYLFSVGILSILMKLSQSTQLRNARSITLKISGKDRVFIEAKKAGEELDGHEQQLLDYSFKKGIKIAVLTNGFEWWFYLPLSEVSWNKESFTQLIYSSRSRAMWFPDLRIFFQKIT